jgi:hypothetical protein
MGEYEEEQFDDLYAAQQAEQEELEQAATDDSND